MSAFTVCGLVRHSSRRKVEARLTDLAVPGHVAAVTQDQAMHPLVFLYKRVPFQTLQGHIDAVRAHKRINIPVAMARKEVAAIISLLDGDP